MKKCTGYLHACEILGRNPEAKPNYSSIEEEDQKAHQALFELTIIIKGQNKLNDFVPKMGDTNQRKYNPWHWIEQDDSKVSGVGLSFFGFHFTHSATDVGSRLVVGTSEEAEYIGTEFLSKYENWLL